MRDTVSKESESSWCRSFVCGGRLVRRNPVIFVVAVSFVILRVHTWHSSQTCQAKNSPSLSVSWTQLSARSFTRWSPYFMQLLPFDAFHLMGSPAHTQSSSRLTLNQIRLPIWRFGNDSDFGFAQSITELKFVLHSKPDTQGTRSCLMVRSMFVSQKGLASTYRW